MIGVAELGTVDALATLVGSRESAEALLVELGIEQVNGVFVLPPFLDAVAERIRATSKPDRPTDPVAIARAVLEPYGIVATQVLAGKRITLMLRASGADRYVVSYDLKKPVEPVRIASIQDRAAKPTAMRLYSTVQRRSGSPQFLASGFDTVSAPPLYMFVLGGETRGWIMTRDDLVELLAETGRSRRRGIAPELGFVQHGSREGTLRLWMPMGHRTGADPTERIAGPDRLLLRPHGDG